MTRGDGSRLTFGKTMPSTAKKPGHRENMLYTGRIKICQIPTNHEQP